MDKSDMSYFKGIWPINLDAFHIWSTVLGALTAFIWDIGPFIALLVALIVGDLITGIIRAAHKKQKVTSWGFHRTVEKIGVELLVILLAEGMRVVLFPPVDITYVAVFVMAMSEFKSIIENVEEILGIQIWKYLKEKFGITINEKDD